MAPMCRDPGRRRRLWAVYRTGPGGQGSGRSGAEQRGRGHRCPDIGRHRLGGTIGCGCHQPLPGRPDDGAGDTAHLL